MERDSFRFVPSSVFGLPVDRVRLDRVVAEGCARLPGLVSVDVQVDADDAPCRPGHQVGDEHGANAVDHELVSLADWSTSGGAHVTISPVRPARYARIGGALYLVIIVGGIIGPLLTSPLIVPDDADATARNIAASAELWQLGIAVAVVTHLCDVPLMLILFLLFSPVNKNVALLALLFNIVATVTLVVSQLTLVAAQLLGADQPALTDVAIHTYSNGEALGLVFFGFTLLSVGYLIRHSAYLPWILGLLAQIAGVSYVVNSFLLLVAPDLANIAFLIPIFIAELSLALWLLVKGVDASKWEQGVRSTLAT